VPTLPGLHPDTGLALAQPRDCLVTDEDLVRLAAAEEMFAGHAEVERRQRERAAAPVDLAGLGIEHGYTLPRRAVG
jgi:hypothetical protein